jgi:hypothetical protein
MSHHLYAFAPRLPSLMAQHPLVPEEIPGRNGIVDSWMKFFPPEPEYVSARKPLLLQQ